MSSAISDEAVQPLSSDLWETPDELYSLLDSIYSFELDAAASEHNHKCKTYFTEYSLERPWATSTFLNPPYSDPEPWVRKALVESLQNKTVVCLLPVATDTKWWFNTCWRASYLVFVYGRLRFQANGIKGGTARFSSAIVTFGDSKERDLSRLETVGKLIRPDAK